MKVGSHGWIIRTASVVIVATGVLLGARPVGHPESSARRPLPPSPALTHDFAVPVLMYHRISELPPGAGPLLQDLTVTPADFEQQVRYLVENGFTILTAGQVERAVRLRRRLPVQAVALTLDDGYDDNFTQAFPILSRYGLDGTLFLVTSTVSSPAHVTWEQAQWMLEDGMEFGSHCVHHYDLTTLSPAALDRELRDSKRELEQRLAVPILQIAYPSGQYSERVRARARLAGYRAGWKKGGGWVTPDSDPLMLPRVRVRGNTTMAKFIRKVRHRPPTRWEETRYDLRS